MSDSSTALDSLKTCKDKPQESPEAVTRQADKTDTCQSKSLFSRIYSTVASVATGVTAPTTSSSQVPKSAPSIAATPSKTQLPSDFKPVEVRSKIRGSAQFDSGTRMQLETIGKSPIEAIPLNFYAIKRRNEVTGANIKTKGIPQIDFNALTSPPPKPKPTLKPLEHKF